MTRNHILTALAAAALACGGSSSGSAISHNNPGTGSSTLLVTGDIIGSISNGSPTASFTVNVNDGTGARVSGATVVISNSGLTGGALTLTETGTGSGRYTATFAGFPNGDFQLSVTKGTDAVSATVGGLGMQTISAPAASATVPANTDLQVSWTTPAQAKQATVSTTNLSAVSMADDGSFTIVAASNPARASQTLTLVRNNEVDLAGGLLGSRLRVSFTSTVAYTVQ